MLLLRIKERLRNNKNCERSKTLCRSGAREANRIESFIHGVTSPVLLVANRT